MLLKDAFGALLNLQSTEVSLDRPGSYSVKVKLAPTNYTRNLEGVQRTVVTGREFVVSKASLDEVGYPIPRRGDRISSTVFGDCTITDVAEMYDLGASVIGYRIRTG